MTATFREAQQKDIPTILKFIHELAEYEKLSHDVVATEDLLRENLFGPIPKAFCVIAEIDQEAVGSAICYYNFSTFKARPSIFIEDLYVPEKYRGKGIGKGFFKFLAAKAIREGCCRMEWYVLDWNEPAIEFYKSLGAKQMNDWLICRLEETELKKIAA